MTPKSPLDQILGAIQHRNRFVLSSHARPDGDSIGSQLALAQALTDLGKTVRIVNHDQAPSFLTWLPGISVIEAADTVTGPYDAAVVLECNSLSRTEVRGLDQYFVINIDHHAGNSMYGAINWFDESAAACTEMVFDVITGLGGTLTRAIGINLYVGVLTDTGSFGHGNITARTFDICRQIAASGVDTASLAAQVYQHSSVGKLKLTGVMLESMQFQSGGRIAVLYVDDHILRATGCADDDMEGLANLPLAARDVEVAILLKTFRNVTRVSLRSKGSIDVRAVAATFAGGGHRNASGFSLSGTRDEIERRVLAEVVAAIDVSLGQRGGRSQQD